MNEVKPISRSKCPSTFDSGDVFFSLVDYRNSRFTGKNPDKIIEFYDSFKNRGDLIEWMKERPKGAAYIHEVEGNKDIVVVIPTADFNGKYARECRENIFKGLHLIFVESAEIPDPYFNYAHNCNIGICKAMEYNPKWVILSNDDMKKIDDVEVLVRSLKSLEGAVDIVFTKQETRTVINGTTQDVVRENLIGRFLFKFFKYFSLFISLSHLNLRNRIIASEKFNVRYHIQPKMKPIYYNLFFRKVLSFRSISDFAIFSGNFCKQKRLLLNEDFVYTNEEQEFSIKAKVNKEKIGFIDYKIDSFVASTNAPTTERLQASTLRGITGEVVLDDFIKSLLSIRQ